MDVERLKEYILENNLIETILLKLGCHHIKHKTDYYQCANPDGDNKSAVCVRENTNLTTVNYTRDISGGKIADLITLVEFYKEVTFPFAIKWICDAIELEYYHDFDAELPESVKLTRMLLDMQEHSDYQKEEEKPLIPISETILSYYKNRVNDMFYHDNISYETQIEFEIGYDEYTNRITIPIRDEIGNLVGVKGRLFQKELSEDDMKYIYIEQCARSQILYGLYKTQYFIKQKKFVFVTESEKGVMQLYSMGFYNAVGIGGKAISKSQIDKLTRLGVVILFVFDKDVERKELEEIAQRFIDGVEIYAILDTGNILDEKESPTDNENKFKKLFENYIFQLK